MRGYCSLTCSSHWLGILIQQKYVAEGLVTQSDGREVRLTCLTPLLEGTLSVEHT